MSVTKKPTAKKAAKKTAAKKTAAKKTAAKKTSAKKKAATKKTAAKKTPAAQTNGSSMSRLQRPIQSMPAWMKHAIDAAGVADAYAARPAYQRNDWVSWITRAKLEATQLKRAASMIRELEEGTHYMGMKWSGR